MNKKFKQWIHEMTADARLQRTRCRCGFHIYKWDWRRLGKYCQYCGRKKRKNRLTIWDE